MSDVLLFLAHWIFSSVTLAHLALLGALVAAAVDNRQTRTWRRFLVLAGVIGVAAWLVHLQVFPPTYLGVERAIRGEDLLPAAVLVVCLLVPYAASLAVWVKRSGQLRGLLWATIPIFVVQIPLSLLTAIYFGCVAITHGCS